MSYRPFFSWREALLQSDLKAGPKYIALVLSTYMNDHGESCFPSQETLAEKSSRSVRDVQRALKILSEAGWIKISKHGFAGQQWKRSEYKISYPAGLKGHDTQSPPLKEGHDTVSEGHDNDDVKVTTHSRPITPLNTPKTNGSDKDRFKKPEPVRAVLDTTGLTDAPKAERQGLLKLINSLPDDSPSREDLQRQIDNLETLIATEQQRDEQTTKG